MIPTSNHNWRLRHLLRCCVVYLLIPTSNHNPASSKIETKVVVYLLIPTSNHNLELSLNVYNVLYIFWFLHQTTTHKYPKYILIELYIFWFLHQTTTHQFTYYFIHGCISFDSYIKPQLSRWAGKMNLVVYLLIPTSNHNLRTVRYTPYPLYIFWFLHQTTTKKRLIKKEQSCISFDSYIKPQQSFNPIRLNLVVYLLIPTSNHNSWWIIKSS